MLRSRTSKNEGCLGGHLTHRALNALNAPNASGLTRQRFHLVACDALDVTVGKSAPVFLILGIAYERFAVDTNRVAKAIPRHITGGTLAFAQAIGDGCIAVIS
jgi:hypothetical protein